MCGAHGNAASAHNHDVAYVGIIFFAGYLADIWNEFAGGGEVDNVVQLYDIVATRNQCFVTAFDGYHVIGQFRSAQLVQGDVQNLSLFAHLGTYQNQCTAAKFPPLAHPAHADG